MERKEIEKKMLEAIEMYNRVVGEGAWKENLIYSDNYKEVANSCASIAESIIQEKDKEIRELKQEIERWADKYKPENCLHINYSGGHTPHSACICNDCGTEL